MSVFTPEQLAQIEALKVEYCSSSWGFNKNLHWGFYADKIYADYYYEARDVDGDWGTACTRNENLTFEGLIEIIKNPSDKFETRSWN